MIEKWNTNRNMIMYRLYGVQYLLAAQKHDIKINISTAWDEIYWCMHTRDYVVLHGAGLGPFLEEVDNMIDRMQELAYGHQ